MAFLELLFQKDDRLTKILKRIGSVADRNNLEAYLVGGVIRDKIIGYPNNDIDVTVIGDGIEFAREIAKSFRLKKVVEYPRFGTTVIPYHEIQIEVASARSEEYKSNSRKPEVNNGSLWEDLSRRDFTVNALAMSLNAERMFELTDLFEGLKDLDAGLLRTPLDPVKTFSDDPLRMLRALRFASQLGFHIENRTFRAISRVRERIEIVSQERITDELVKMLMVRGSPSVGFYLLMDSGLMEIILPEISVMEGIDQRDGYHHKDVFRHTLQVLDNISRVTTRLDLRFSALVHDIAKPVTKEYIKGKGWTFYGHEELGAKMIRRLCRRLKLPVKLMEFAMKLTRLHLRPISLAQEGVTDSALRRLIVDAGEDIDDLITLCRADITSANPARVNEYMGNFDRVVRNIKDVLERDKMRAFQSPVRGDEIMKYCGLKSGKRVGYIKKCIEEAILQGEIPNTYEASKEFLITNKERLLKDKI